jgi:hypothetical protein
VPGPDAAVAGVERAPRLALGTHRLADLLVTVVAWILLLTVRACAGVTTAIASSDGLGRHPRSLKLGLGRFSGLHKAAAHFLLERGDAFSDIRSCVPVDLWNV